MTKGPSSGRPAVRARVLGALLLSLGTLALASALVPTAAQARVERDPCAALESSAGWILDPTSLFERNALRGLACSSVIDLPALGLREAVIKCPRWRDDPWMARDLFSIVSPWTAEWDWVAGWGGWITWDGLPAYIPYTTPVSDYRQALPNMWLEIVLHNWWPGRAERIGRAFMACYGQKPADARTILGAWDPASFASASPLNVHVTLARRSKGRRLAGTDRADRLTGGRGADQLWGGDGHDVLAGGSGDDTLLGGRGDDRLVGGPGDDALFDNRGANRIDAGPGDDIISVRGGGRDAVCCGSGFDIVVAGRHDRVARDCERVYRPGDRTPRRPPGARGKSR